MTNDVFLIVLFNFYCMFSWLKCLEQHKITAIMVDILVLFSDFNGNIPSSVLPLGLLFLVRYSSSRKEISLYF